MYCRFHVEREILAREQAEIIFRIKDNDERLQRFLAEYGQHLCNGPISPGACALFKLTSHHCCENNQSLYSSDGVSIQPSSSIPRPPAYVSPTRSTYEHTPDWGYPMNTSHSHIPEPVPQLLDRSGDYQNSLRRENQACSDVEEEWVNMSNVQGALAQMRVLNTRQEQPTSNIGSPKSAVESKKVSRKGRT